VVAPIELDDATALGRALGVLILLREGRCTREAMRRALRGLLEAERIERRLPRKRRPHLSGSWFWTCRREYGSDERRRIQRHPGAARAA
jgi:hypothetical protein